MYRYYGKPSIMYTPADVSLNPECILNKYHHFTKNSFFITRLITHDRTAIKNCHEVRYEVRYELLDI